MESVCVSLYSGGWNRCQLTNFVLADFSSPERAAAAFDFLRDRGIVVRPMGGYGLPACLRITVGLAAHMQLTIDALETWQGEFDGE